MYLFYEENIKRVLQINYLICNQQTLNRVIEFTSGPCWHWIRLNHRPVASHWQVLSHNVVSSIPCPSEVLTHNFSGDGHWLHMPSTANMYKCQNKELISSLMVCDGYHDCHDNSDEMYCGKKF
jgi:hypothetical protein